MKGKLMFAAGIGAGFVIGSRAGTQSYAAIKERAQTVAQSPSVQKAVHTAKDFAETKAPKLTSVVAGATSTVGGVAGAAKDAAPVEEDVADVPDATDDGVDVAVDPEALAGDAIEGEAARS